MQPFFSINDFKSHKKVTEFFTVLKTFKTVMVFSFDIKKLKRRKKVMEFFFSINNFKSRKKVTESFFSGHASLTFHVMHRFPGTIFSLSVPTKFIWL